MHSLTTTGGVQRGVDSISLKQKLLGPCLLLVGTISLAVFTLLELNVIDLHEKDAERGTKAATFVVGGFELLTRAVRDDGVGASWERERWVELRDVERYVVESASRERERERLRPRRFLRERREHFRSF